MRGKNSYNIALCGLMAALATAIMCLSGLIPVSTYVCLVVCILIGNIILKICGDRLAWVWYVAVCLFVVLLSPDKEVAYLYIFFGYYPYIKALFDRSKLGIFFKLVYFNATIALAYSILLWIIGAPDITRDYEQIGMAGVIITLILGNATFFVLDALLGRRYK